MGERRFDKRYGCTYGHDSGIRRITESDRNGVRTWYECIECGVTVQPIQPDREGTPQ